jgi:hypothetical protein
VRYFGQGHEIISNRDATQIAERLMIVSSICLLQDDICLPELYMNHFEVHTQEEPPIVE